MRQVQEFSNGNARPAEFWRGYGSLDLFWATTVKRPRIPTETSPVGDRTPRGTPAAVQVSQERGGTLVEAAIVLPLLLLLTFGIWTTARAWNVNNTMQHAVREAARFGATVDPWDPATSPSQVRSIADADMSTSAIDTTAVDTVCIELIADGEDSCDGSHSNITGTNQVFVKLSYPNYRLQFLFFTLDIEMTATAVSRHESPG